MMKLGLLILAQTGNYQVQILVENGSFIFYSGLLPWLDQGGSGGALEPQVGQPLKLWGDGGPQPAGSQSQIWD